MCFLHTADEFILNNGAHLLGHDSVYPNYKDGCFYSLKSLRDQQAYNFEVLYQLSLIEIILEARNFNFC